MQLFGNYTSPFVRHCRIALLETGVPCEFVESDAQTSARRSPAQKLPFLQDGELLLTDSTSIIRHLRERAGQGFFADIENYDRFCLANTLMDAAVNLFMLEKDGITPEQSPYLQRQRHRIDTSLESLAKSPLSDGAPYNDFELRLGCILAWSRYRQRFEFSQHPALAEFLGQMNQYDHFRNTAPPKN